MAETKFVECEKLAEKREQVNDLMEFLTFLNKNGVQFGEHRNCINNTPWLNPINLERNGEILAAKFLGIDMDKVEQERVLLERSIHS
ncbi:MULTISPECIES: hypothetical protein [Vibrio]|uniref:hypothetical protein n=1 Tax=Vibrio TaxID=662 RepID=UPI001E596615|nr:hypothetical protein [Vibrio lentus]MCC4838055.1 hypothetical protein [Vibrio lentus]